MSLQIGVRQVSEVTVLDLTGRITLGEEASSLRELIRELAVTGKFYILLNLANVSYIDSSGLGELVGAYATVTSQGGKLKLLNLQNRITELMQITKLYSIFETFTDEERAIRSFQRALAAG